jgi:hypothetical protein
MASGGKGMGERDEYGSSATHTRTTHMTDDGEDDEEDFGTPSKFAKSTASRPAMSTNKSTNANSSFMDTINAIKAESASKKRKIGPKIEGFEDGDEGDADAIDFSIGYTGSTVVKREEGGEIVDLTDDPSDITNNLVNDAASKEKSKNGKGKEKENGKGREKMGDAGSIFNTKVKKEVIDLGGMGDDEDDEMVV